MANLIRTRSARDADNQKNSNHHPNQLLSSKKPSQSDTGNDDLIVSLSDAYENRRARQVGEWERLYQHNVYRAI